MHTQRCARARWDRLSDALERSHLCSDVPGITNLLLPERRAHLNGSDHLSASEARVPRAGILGVGLPLRLLFVRPDGFLLIRTRLRRRFLRLCRNSVRTRIVGEALTVCAIAGAARRHRRARTWRRSLGRRAIA